MLPARGKYLEHDVRRTKDRAGKPEIQSPEDFMSMSKTVLVSELFSSSLLALHLCLLNHLRFTSTSAITSSYLPSR